MLDVFGTWIGGEQGLAHIKSLVTHAMAASSGWARRLPCLEHHRIPSMCLHPGPRLEQQTLSMGGQGSQGFGEWTTDNLSWEWGTMQEPRFQVWLLFHGLRRLQVQNINSVGNCYELQDCDHRALNPKYKPLWAHHGSVLVLLSDTLPWHAHWYRLWTGSVVQIEVGRERIGSSLYRPLLVAWISL